MTEKNEKKKQRTDEELLEALDRMEALEETLAMSDAEIEAEMRAEGRDPDEVGKRYVEHVKKLVGDAGPQRLAAGVSRNPKDLTLEELISPLRTSSFSPEKGRSVDRASP